MSLSATLFGEDSLIHKVTNIMGLGIPGMLNDWAKGPGAEPTKLGELSQQTAKEAEPRAIIWGLVRPIGGNIMHCQAPVKKMVKSYVESGGKGGGGKKKEKTYKEHVYRTHAVGVCEGPITAFGRIWRNNKLVYDGRLGSAWGAANNAVFLKAFRLYLGGWDQMPDPTLQSIWGIGNVPAYRGTAYMVAINEDLTDLGGSVPQFMFEVERAEGRYLTSRPYSVEEITGVDLSAAGAKESPNTSYAEAVDTSLLSIDSLTLRDTIQVYDRYAPEGIDYSSLTIVDGFLKSSIISYSTDPDGVDASSLSIIDGFLKDVVRTYDQYQPEAIDASALTIISGTLA